MTAERITIGLIGKHDVIGTPLTYALDDADDAIAMTFLAPKTGTISKIGFYVTAVTGSPPSYQAVLNTIDASGKPSGSLYGGSAAETVAISATGWTWITLSTPGSATAGDPVAAVLKPTGTAPSAANCITASYGSIGVHGYGSMRFTTAWGSSTGSGIMAIQYNGGDVFGLALTTDAIAASFANDDTPDEIGAKFIAPFDATLHRATIYAYPVNFDGTAAIVLYDGADNTLATWTITDADHAKWTGGVTLQAAAGIGLTGGATYRITIKPSSTTNVALFRYKFESAAAKLFAPWAGSFSATERTDGGAWTDTANDMIECALELSVDFAELGDGGGGSGEYVYIG